jgi:hypothetical protein
MQTILSEIAFTFVDDAIALANGLVDVARTLVVESFAALRARVFAPIDRLAQACDVGNVISARQAAASRHRARRAAARHNAPPPRRLLDRLNPFRGLYDLT